MRKITFSLALLAIFSFSFTGIDNHESQVKKAATAQLQDMLAKIPVGQEFNFGFTSREEFKSATIGEVYRTISLTNEFYADKELLDKNYIRIQNEWRVPVVVNEMNKTLLTVFGEDTALNVVDIGGTMLANEMKVKTAGFESKEKFIFRIYPLVMDFLVFAEHGKELSAAEYYPMNSAKTAVPSLGDKALTQAEVFRIIKSELAKSPVRH